jgi:hypothetical protein
VTAARLTCGADRVATAVREDDPAHPRVSRVRLPADIPQLLELGRRLGRALLRDAHGPRERAHRERLAQQVLEDEAVGEAQVVAAGLREPALDLLLARGERPAVWRAEPALEGVPA